MVYFEIGKGKSVRRVADPELFHETDPDVWEQAYEEVMHPKYTKTGRNFSRRITGNPHASDDPPIYMIPRVRAGPSYKDHEVSGASVEDIAYCPISKGYPMQEVSSFTLGPVVGEGLCIVNAAFSKIICISHIEGGGCVDYKRKHFWRKARVPERQIELVDDSHITVDGDVWVTNDWLAEHEHLWFDEWEKWRKSVALCGLGDFHWSDGSPVVSYAAPHGSGDWGPATTEWDSDDDWGEEGVDWIWTEKDQPSSRKYLSFVEWKKQCYIQPSYDLLPQTEVFQFLQRLRELKRPLGLVHPMVGGKYGKNEAITREWLVELFDSPTVMACQPFVVAARLLGVEV